VHRKKESKEKKVMEETKVGNFSRSERNGLGGWPPSSLISLLTHLLRHSAITINHG